MELNYILVVGLNRSGTKWLSNILARNEEVVAISAADHFGIVETNVLNDFARIFSSLQRDDDYAAFVTMWSETDFVRIAGFSKHEILNWQPRPKSVIDAFARLMNELADRSGKIWLQKCNPAQACDAIDQFPGRGKNVLIQRPFISVLESSIALKKQSGVNSSFIRDVVVNAIQSRLLTAHSNHANSYLVSFEELKSDPKRVVEDVCEFLQIGFDEQMLEPEFQQNTSFNGKKVRSKLSFSQKLVANTLRFVFSLLPAAMVKRIWERSRARNPFSMVTGSYHGLFVDAKNSVSNDAKNEPACPSESAK